MWHRTLEFYALFLFSSYSYRSPPLRTGGDLGNLTTHTVAQDCYFLCCILRRSIFAPLSLTRDVAVARFLFWSVHARPAPPLLLVRRWFSLAFSRPLRIGLLAFPFPWRSFSASPPRRLEVWERVLRSRIFHSVLVPGTGFSTQFRTFLHTTVCGTT